MQRTVRSDGLGARRSPPWQTGVRNRGLFVRTPRAVIGRKPDIVGARRGRANKCKARQLESVTHSVGGDRRAVVGYHAIGRISALRPAQPNTIFRDAVAADRVDAARATDCPSATARVVAVTVGGPAGRGTVTSYALDAALVPTDVVSVAVKRMVPDRQVRRA